MGAIIGLVSKNGHDVAKEATMMLAALSLKDTDTWEIASATEARTINEVDQLGETFIRSAAIIGHAFEVIQKGNAAQPHINRKGSCFFDGTIYSETIPKNQKLQKGTSVSSCRRILRREGGFVFITIAKKCVAAGRASIGTRPLYYGENSELLGLCTERKGLWRIGITRTHSFPPGNIVILTPKSFRFEKVEALATKTHVLQRDPTKAATELLTLLERAVRKRVSGEKEVAVAFSGGLDSGTITYLVKKCGVSPQLVHVSLSGSKEHEEAQRAAKELGLSLHSHLYTRDSVKDILPKIIRLIEEANPINVSIAIPIFWAAENARKLGLRVMLAGQGADELFGGYERYVKTYANDGKADVEEMIRRDILQLHTTNLERDFKACNSNVDLRLPFTDFEVVQFALNTPIELKIEPNNKTHRKLILRRTAERLGLPHEIVFRPKKAVQYSTGVNKALRAIARSEGKSVRAYTQGLFEMQFGNDVS